MEQWRGDPKEIELGKKIEEELKKKMLDQIQAQHAFIQNQLYAKKLVHPSKQAIDSLKEEFQRYRYTVPRVEEAPMPVKPNRLKRLLARLGGYKDGQDIRPVTSTDDSTH